VVGVMPRSSIDEQPAGDRTGDGLLPGPVEERSVRARRRLWRTEPLVVWAATSAGEAVRLEGSVRWRCAARGPRAGRDADGPGPILSLVERALRLEVARRDLAGLVSSLEAVTAGVRAAVQGPAAWSAVELVAVEVREVEAGLTPESVRRLS
jgi:hypothetical protein